MTLIYILWKLAEKIFYAKGKRERLRKREVVPLVPFSISITASGEALAVLEATSARLAALQTSASVSSERVSAALAALSSAPVYTPAWTSTPQPQTCRGCRNWHGIAYRGTLLVCAMHPYGTDGADCPDWERLPLEEPIE